jgi:hypothetical protein
MQKAIEGSLPGHLVEIGESFEQKYQPVLDFEGWRLAMLRHSEATDHSLFHQVERHNETHEVFILTDGEADLIIAGDALMPDQNFVFPMRRNVAYNILPGVWHHIVVSVDAHVIIFEKSNTSRNNSDYYTFDSIAIETLQQKIRNFKIKS